MNKLFILGMLLCIVACIIGICLSIKLGKFDVTASFMVTLFAIVLLIILFR